MTESVDIKSKFYFSELNYNVTDFYTYNSSSDNGLNSSTMWAFGSLALARVETPFDFYGEEYHFCNYYPQIISVNFLKKFEEPGTEAIALGWGNSRFYRPASIIDLLEW